MTMASISLVSRLLFVAILTVVAVYSTISYLEPRNDLKRSSDTLKRPVLPGSKFSPTTDCEEFLDENPEMIVYNFGVNQTSAGAVSLRNCLKRDEAAQVRQNVHEIHISFPIFSEPNEEQQPLQEILQILPNLKSVKCNGHYYLCRPLDLQRSKMNTTWSLHFDRNFDREVNLPIECSSNSLEYDGGTNDERLDQLYHVLVSCENVKSLSLTLSQGGCVIGDTRRSFRWQKDDRFPPLENLTLSGYDWNFDNNIHQISNAAQWRAHMDWSELRRLDISLPSNSFLESFRGQLDNLESLVLRPEFGFWGDEEALCDFDLSAEELRQNYSSFITALPPLRKLSMSGMGRLLNMTPILEAHGDSLEELSIHEFERDCRQETGNATWVRPVLSVPETEEIVHSAPNLREFELDVYRSAKWPTSMLRTLAKFPKLTGLTINFNLEDPSRTRLANWCLVNEQARDRYCTVSELMEPPLNSTTAVEIFHTIRGYNADSALRRVTLIAGDFERRVGGGMRLIPHYESPEPVRYDCWIVEGDAVDCRGLRKSDFL